jgi:hypothetical protein
MIKAFLYIGLYLCTLGCSKHLVPATEENQQAVEATTHIVKVSTADQLKAALQNAKPNDEIVMADGIYNGKFVIETSGTATQPVILRGSRNVILDAGSTNTGYVLYLHASYWKLKGFTIRNGLKGLMCDEANHNLIDSLKIYQTGEEALHLRKFSSYNTVQYTEITETGIKTPDYGEGIYIGSAKNNWANYSNGNPDLCDSNIIVYNKIGPAVAAECIDVKEGTTGGIIRSNSFDATGITGANSGDSWIDVKGNGYLLELNKGYHPAGGTIFKDGYQVHCAVNGWGNNNIFKSNQCTVNASGYGINVQLSGSNGTTTGNKVYSNNQVTGASSGVSNIPLSN